MTATLAATTVRAASLKEADVFVYGGNEQSVLAVTSISDRFVEVHTFDQDEARERWIDYGLGETVGVVRGPSAAKPVVVAEPALSATLRARAAIRLGKVRDLPASAALVLYALAAAQEEVADGAFAPSLSSVAVGAGLAISTTKGHLSALRAKGLVRETGLGWVITA
jgi:hypothetical protein